MFQDDTLNYKLT